MSELPKVGLADVPAVSAAEMAEEPPGDRRVRRWPSACWRWPKEGRTERSADRPRRDGDRFRLTRRLLGPGFALGYLDE